MVERCNLSLKLCNVDQGRSRIRVSHTDRTLTPVQGFVIIKPLRFWYTKIPNSHGVQNPSYESRGVCFCFALTSQLLYRTLRGCCGLPCSRLFGEGSPLTNNCKRSEHLYDKYAMVSQHIYTRNEGPRRGTHRMLSNTERLI